MKRALKFLGYALVALVVLLAAAGSIVYALSSRRLSRTYEVAVPAVAVPADAAALARGRHIAETRGCVECHGKDFGGKTVINAAPIGLIGGTNLTGGRGSMTRGFTTDDWVRAIRHGVARDGHPLVLMPSIEFSHFSDEDLGCLIAFLNSLSPVDRDRVPITVGPVARLLILTGEIKLAAEHIDHAGLRPAAVAPGVTVEYGRYLANGCVGCHGESLAGGRIPGGAPDWPPSQNLTPAGDLGKWNEADFLRTLRTGTRPDGSKLNPVMPITFGQMNETELKAIWAFLQTVPPVAASAH